MQNEMIKTKALITAIDNKYIYLLAADSSACASCSSMCSNKNKITKIKFKDGFKVGEEVNLISNMGEVVSRSLLLYGLPVLSILIIAIVTSSLLKLPEIWSAILSLLSVPATYQLLKIFYKNKITIAIEKS